MKRVCSEDRDGNNSNNIIEIIQDVLDTSVNPVGVSNFRHDSTKDVFFAPTARLCVCKACAVPVSHEKAILSINSQANDEVTCESCQCSFMCALPVGSTGLRFVLLSEATLRSEYNKFMTAEPTGDFTRMQFQRPELVVNAAFYRFHQGHASGTVAEDAKAYFEEN